MRALRLLRSGGGVAAPPDPAPARHQRTTSRPLAAPRPSPSSGSAMLTPLPDRNLDVLRAVAVLCVLLCHLLTQWGRALPLITNWELGRAGVLMFFVHTSLVLMGSLERQGARRDWVRAFYIRRAFRIYPLTIASILVVALLVVPSHLTTELVTGPPITLTPATVIANLALVQNVVGRPDILQVLWSLPLEVQMYVALPFAFRLAQRGLPATIAGLLAAGALGLAVLHHAPVPGLWRLSVAVFGPCFMAGVLAYALLRMRRAPIAPAWTWGLLLLACLRLHGILAPGVGAREGEWLFCLIIGCAIPVVRELADSWITRVAHIVCTYSFGIYLLHTTTIWVAFTVLRSAPLAVQWTIFAVLLGGLPALAYRLIEQPGIDLGKRLVHRPVVLET